MSKLPHSVDRQVGERIRLQRRLLGVSLGELSRALGLTVLQLQQYERGDERIGAHHLAKIAKALLVSPNFFFNQNARPRLSLVANSDESGDEFRDLDEGLELQRAFVAIENARLRKLIVDFVVLLAQTETAARRGASHKNPDMQQV